MKERTKREIITLITVTIGVIIGAIVGVYITGLIIEKEAAKLETALQQTEEIFEIQKFSEYKGEIKAIKDLYVKGSITSEDAIEKTTAVINTVEADHIGFANSVEVNVAKFEETFSSMEGSPLPLMHATINQLEDVIEQVKAD